MVENNVLIKLFRGRVAKRRRGSAGPQDGLFDYEISFVTVY